MGLKIGKWLKKNVRFKNVVKFAGQVVPGVGGAVISGLSDAHEAKKLARQEANDEQTRLYWEKIAEEKAKKAGADAGQYVASNAGNFFNSAYQNASQGVKDTAGHVGLSVAMDSLRVGFQKYWKPIVLVVTVIVVGIFAFRRPRPTRKSYR